MLLMNSFMNLRLSIRRRARATATAGLSIVKSEAEVIG
jgi:hypothetical protein